MALDLYQRLGLKRGASEAEIKKAYRSLAKQLHPDRNKDNPKAADRFAQVTAAYDMLSDKDKRARYDRGEIDEEGNPKMPFGGGFGGYSQGAGGGPQPGAGFENFNFSGAEGADLSDLFEGLFGAASQGRAGGGGPFSGFRQRGRAAPKRADVAYRLKIPFEDAVALKAQRITLADGKTIDLKLPQGLEDGTRIRLTDTAGDACVHALLYRAGNLHERLNVADTVKVPWQAYFTTGHPLLSDAGRLMATIVADGSSRHDALTGATTLAGNTAKYGAGTVHSASPAARELLTLGALKHGLGPRDVAPSISFFKGITVDPDGSITFTGSAGPGAAVELLLQLDTVLVLANTAHPLDPRGEFTGTAVDIVAWHTPQDLTALEAGRLAGPLAPEHLQALHNTEHDLTARNAR